MFSILRPIYLLSFVWTNHHRLTSLTQPELSLWCTQLWSFCQLSLFQCRHSRSHCHLLLVLRWFCHRSSLILVSTFSTLPVLSSSSLLCSLLLLDIWPQEFKLYLNWYMYMSLLHWLSFLLSSEHTSTFPGNPPAPYSQYRCPQRFLPDLICQDVCYQCKQKGGGLWCNPTSTLNPPVSLSLYMSCTNHSWQPQFLSCELWTCMLSLYPQMHSATLSDHLYFFWVMTNFSYSYTLTYCCWMK